MRMTIDKSIRILVDRYIDTYVVCGGANYNPRITIAREDYEALKMAINTMRKHQKIEQIVSDFRKYQKGITWGFGGEKYMQMVSEVVEDGED